MVHYSDSFSQPAERAIYSADFFSGLAEAERKRLVMCMTKITYNAGTNIVNEGEPGDTLYLITEGTADVSIRGDGEPLALGSLGPGDAFGELALLEPHGVRHATITSTTPIALLALAREEFQVLLVGNPALSLKLAAAAERMLTIRFLKQATPFASLLPEELASLAGRLRRLALGSGDDAVRQGMKGEDAYLVRSGRLEVILEHNRTERRLATLAPGSLFGEAALLSNEPRNATVRALEPSELLVLSRSDLEWCIGQNEQVAGRLTWLLNSRSRPRRLAGVEIHSRDNGRGEIVTVLKDPFRRTYYRLSPQGLFIWNCLDGTQTMRMLSLAYFAEFKLFAPDTVAALIAGLVSAGFAWVPSSKTSNFGTEYPGRMQLILSGVTRVIDWQIALSNVDRPLSRIYMMLHPLFTVAGQVGLSTIMIAGLLAFLMSFQEASRWVEALTGADLAWIFVLGFAGAVFLHELGHALAVKAFGREVSRVGVGWYLFGPIAFVDTSDMWIAGRWERIIVSLAGPYANAVTGSIAALAASAIAHDIASALLWGFACMSYVIAITNMNPLLELDGYYVLSDWLDRPNLRRQSLSRLGSILSAQMTVPDALSLYRTDVIYALASLSFVGFVAVLTLVSYRLLLQNWVTMVLGEQWGAGLAWGAAAMVVALNLIAVANDVLAVRRKPGTAA